MHSDKAVDLQPVRLLEIAEEVEAAASAEARARGLALRVEVAAGLEVDADRNYLISALSNLVQNAIKYSKPDGEIWVRSRETDKSLVLEVEDRCGGLPKGKTEELFKPFIQKNSDRTGLGLGLTISRQAIALNGGVLAARDLPGKGCVFSISLPKRRAHRSPARARRARA
jgi:signal transduction histidine kinase